LKWDLFSPKEEFIPRETKRIWRRKAERPI